MFRLFISLSTSTDAGQPSCALALVHFSPPMASGHGDTPDKISLPAAAEASSSPDMELASMPGNPPMTRVSPYLEIRKLFKDPLDLSHGQGAGLAGAAYFLLA